MFKPSALLGKITPKLGAQILCAIIGIAIISLASSLFFLSNLGADPYQVLCQALHLRFNITIGMANNILNGFIIVAIIIFKRKYLNLALVLSLFLSGLFVDGFLALLTPLLGGQSMALRIGQMVVGCLLLSFGVFLYTVPKLGASPADSLGLMLAEVVKQPYSRVRIGTDGIYTFLGYILGGTVGVTTLTSVALTGPIIGVFEKLLGKTKIIKYLSPSTK